jgi:AraC-like DNA-binding protein
MNWLTVIAFLGIWQALFLGSALLFKASKNSAPVFLAILLFIEAIGLAEQSLYFSQLIYNFPHFLGVSYPLAVLRPLLIFLFARSYFQELPVFRKVHLLHALPLLLYSLLFAPLIFSSAQDKIDYLNTTSGTVWSDNTQGIIFFLINNAIYAAYYWFTWKTIVRSKQALMLEKSSQPKWVRSLVVFFLLFYLFKLVLYLLNGMHLLASEQFGTIVMLISSFTIQVIAMFLLTKARWPAFTNVSAPSSKETGLLTQVLEVDKAFLDDELTVKKLSLLCGIPHERITELIRLSYRQSFKDTINQLRVAEAQRLIKDDLNGKAINLLGIALDSGFNNKVTFYRAFKKVTGLAPSDYVKKLESAS